MTSQTLSGSSRPPAPVAPPLAVVDQLHKYLSDGFCSGCSELLKSRIIELASSGTFDNIQMPGNNSENQQCPESVGDSQNLGTPSGTFSSLVNGNLSSSSVNSSWSRDSSLARRGHVPNAPNHRSPMSVQSKLFEKESEDGEVDDDDLVGVERTSNGNNGLSKEERERLRFSQVGWKKDFVFFERVDGRKVNVLEGLELHTKVFSVKEQKRIVDCIYSLQKRGRNGEFRDRTYSEPKKWMRGKGRQTIQFGCCYNYAVDKNGNPPGIIRDEEVDPLPPLFKSMIKRMVRWHVLPPSCIPNSCIVNIYDEGDCIPPHIDHHDFVRPFCTVSFLAECNILFGLNLKAIAPGEFSGPMSIPLPVGSVFILNGNGADVAKHCVPGVPAKRISITFRKMDDSKLPFKFLPDPELQNIQPLPYPSSRFPTQQNRVQVQSSLHTKRVVQAQDDKQSSAGQSKVVEEIKYGTPFHLAHDDFPPLGGSDSAGRSSSKPKHSIRQ